VTTSVLFVCLGNICRSPTAEAVFRARAAARQQQLEVDSAGTGDWHIGKAPDARATRAAQQRGYDLSSLRARQVTVNDFYRFDYLLAMDRNNLSDLLAMQPEDSRARLSLFLDFHAQPPSPDVPDPYYGGEDGFEQVLDLVEQACDGLLDALTERSGA
jgi:protein-tyrosine phosphatase